MTIEMWPWTSITQMMKDSKRLSTNRLKKAKYVSYVVCPCVDIKRNVASDCLNRLITDHPTMSSEI